MRLLSGLLVGLVLGCGGDDGVSPREARAELADRGIAYTERAFLRAAAEGDLDVVKLFVAAGMSVDAADDEYGFTALHGAALNGHLGVVKFLVGAGADVHATDDDGETALHNAAWGGHLEIVKFLVGSGSAVDATTDYGFTALHGAAYWGHLDVVEFLVTGADLEAMDRDGETALHRAVYWGHLEIVKVLVGAGADVDATTNEGETPRALAASCRGSDERRARCAAVVAYFDSL